MTDSPRVQCSPLLDTLSSSLLSDEEISNSGFSYFEEGPIDAATILRRLPCLTKTIPERFFLPLNNSSDEDAVPPPTDSIANTNSTAIDRQSPLACGGAIVSHSSTSITSNTLEAEKPSTYKVVKQAEKIPCKTFSRTCQSRKGTIVGHDPTQSTSANSNATKATRTADVASSTVSDIINNTSCPVSELVPAFVSLTADLAITIASTTSVPADQNTPRRGCLQPGLTTSEQKIVTVASKNRKKTVRFVEGLKDSEKIQTRGSKATEYPEGSEQLRDLIREVYDNPTLKEAIELLSLDTFSKIAFSLIDDLAIPLVSAAADIRSQRVNSKSDTPVTDIAPNLLEPGNLEPHNQMLKQYMLNFLDEKTNQSYLCCACELFHSNSWHRYRSVSSIVSIDCPSQHVLNSNSKNHRLFITPFCSSQIQYAMKLFRHGMFYGQRLKPLLHALPEIGTNLSCVRTSKVYPVADEEHGERLLSRIQNWYHTSPDIETPLSKKEMTILGQLMGKDSSMTHLCSHLMKRYAKEKDQGFILWDYEDLNSNPLVRKCENCALEYRYDWYEAGEYGSGLVLTTWRDFGKCLTPLDPRWIAHFEEYDDIASIPDEVADVARLLKGLSASGSDLRSKNDQKLKWLEDMEPAAPSWEVGKIQKMFEANDEFDLQWCMQRMIKSERMREAPFESLPGKRKRHFGRERRRERKRLLETEPDGKTPNGSTDST